ncbi:hypothetical protein Pan97_14850 [Bremerella volcania]|uniref:Uncharacterized protein n=2 Tax=Bremerella volcania TaxID=2527984 RepID=A0A518C5H3_9BACT|nr:hypothetical protein Pan97_14850 [Bremerella volcania]
MILSDDEPIETTSNEPIADDPWLAISPDGQRMPASRPSPWDEIARRQDAAKEAAWEAFTQAEKAKQDERHAAFLQSDDPKFCADYLTVPIDPEVAAYAFPDEDPPPLPTSKRTRSPRVRDSKPSRAREKNWREVVLAEPYSYQEKRYLAWTYYRLKLQDLELQEKIRVKQAKIERLRCELGGAIETQPYEKHLPGDDVPTVRPHVEVVEFDLMYWLDQARHANKEHAHADAGMVPGINSTNERGPPKNPVPSPSQGEG